ADSLGRRQQTIGFRSGEGQSDQAHASGGSAVPARGPKRLVVGLAITDETGGNVIVEEILERLSLQSQQEGSFPRRQGSVISHSSHFRRIIPTGVVSSDGGSGARIGIGDTVDQCCRQRVGVGAMIALLPRILANLGLVKIGAK